MVLESNTLDVLFVKDGQQGEDGKILYTWIKYAKDASGTGITDDPNGAIYIGISYNNESSIESNDPTHYAWTKIQGADGKKGEDAYTIFLENENISFATDKNRNPLSEQAYTSGITIMKGAKPVTDFTIGDIAKTQGIAVAKTDTAIAISVVNGNPLPNDNGEIEIPITVGGTVFKKILTWTCAKKGDQGEKGENGKDGTSVTIINKSITYQLSTSGTVIPKGTWQTSPQTIPEGQYQWTKTSVTYSDGNKTESYSISYHGKNGNDGTSVKTTGTSVKYQVGDSGTTKPTGTWQSNVPTVAQGKYLWTQTIVNYSDGNSTESYSVSYRGIDGSNGVNGMNTATIYLYQRATSTPSKPSNTLTYTFSTTKITGTLNNGWSTTIPTGTDAVYVTVASVSSKNDTATIATSVWSAPVVLAQNGKTGSDGKAGLNVATIYLYQRNTSKPSKPSASVTYTFSTGVASGLNNGWSQKIPNGTNPLYVTLATASSNTATDTILSSEWSDVVVMAQNGEDGQDGISPKVSLLKSGDTTTISIVDATGTHTQTVKDGTNGTPGAAGKDGKTSYFHVKYSNDGGKTFTGNSGEDTGTYMGSYTDYTEADSTDVKKYNWVKVKGDKGDKGDTGQKGQDGTSVKITSKSVTYQTSTSGTIAPTGTWVTTVPTINNGQYLWTKTTVQYSDGNKTEAYSVSYKGTNGTNGTSVTVSKTEVTYQVSASGTTAPTGTWSTTMPSCDQGQYLWTKTYVKYSDGKDTTSYSVSYKGVDGEKFAFNMLRETNQGSKHWVNLGASGKYSVESITTDDNINAAKLICTEAIASNEWQFCDFSDYEMLKSLKASTTYTLSYDIKANRSGKILHNIKTGGGQKVFFANDIACKVLGNETWEHVSLKMTSGTTLPNLDGQVIYMFGDALSKVGYSIIKNLKLTEGIVDTPWAPHPEDLEGRGVSETVQYYLATSQASGVTSSTSGWSTDITTQKLTADKKYLWNCYQTKYSDGTSEPISTPKVIGVYGDKGTSTKIIRTSYEYTQTNIDKFSTSGYSGVWGVNDATTGLKVGDSVLLKVKNTTKCSDCLIFANITAIPSNYSLTCTSYGVIDNGSDGQDGAGFHWNLLKYSGDLSKQVLGGAGTYTATVESIEDKTTPSGQAEKITYTVQGTGGKFIQTGKYIKEGDIKQGKTYTVSVWCKCSSIKSTGVINAEFLDNKTYVNPTLSTEWQQYVVTGVANKDVTSTSSASAISFYYSDNMSVGDIFYISSPKVEEGDKASPWCTTYEETLAKNLTITPSSQYFKSTDGGKTFAPNTITIKPTIQGEISFGKWQYSIDGGVSFADVVSGQKGLTVSNNVLTVSKDSSLYSDAVTMITFRAVADDSSFYDTCNIAKIYDVSDIGDGRNLLWNSNFAKTDEAITGTTNSWGLHTRGTNLVASIDTSTKHNGFNTLKTVSAANGDKNSSNDLEWFAWGISERTSDNLHSKNQNYTLSFYAKASVTTDFIVRWGYDAYGADTTRTLTTNWQKYEIKLHQATSAYSITIIFKLLTAGTVWFSEFKLEKGSSATGYSTAPEDLQTAILSTKNSIDSVSSKVDTNTKSIQDKVSKTTYERELTLVKGDLSKANEGLNKWRYEIYPKSLFDSADQGKSTIDIFAKNLNLVPSQTVLLDDASLSTGMGYGDNHIAYALTFVKMSAKKDVTTKMFNDDGASLYVNGGLIITRPSEYTNGEEITFTLAQGWNCIEVVVNEGGGDEGFRFSTTLSKLSECQMMNCYYGTPVARQSRITNQLVDVTKNLNGVTSTVQDVMTAVGNSGNITEFKNNYSKWKQSVDKIETRVGEKYVTNEKFNGLEIGGRNLLTKDDCNMSKWQNLYPAHCKITSNDYLNHVDYVPTGNEWEIVYKKISVTKGQKYILSFDYKINKAYNYLSGQKYGVYLSTSVPTNAAPANIITNGQYVIENTVTNIKRGMITFTAAVDTLYIVINGGCIDDNQTGLSFEFNKWKLEKGNKATDWTPAPEDNEINGQNLVSNLPDNWEQGGFDDGKTNIGCDYATNKTSMTTRIRCAELIPVSGQVTISNAYANSQKPIQYWITAFDVNKKWLGKDYVSTAWTNFPATVDMKDAKYLAIMVGYTDSSAITPSDISQICLKVERGTSATPFTLAPEDVNGKIVNVETIANQTAKKFEWIVNGESTSSNLVLTDNALTAIANNINLTGKVTFNSFDQSLKDTINNKMNVSYLKFSSGGNKQGFFKIATLQMKQTHADQNIIFGVNHREHGYTECRIRFSNAGNTDPGMGSFKQTGTPTRAWRIIKTATSTWDLYLAKTDSWDGGRVIKFDNPYGGGLLVTWSGASADLPDGAIIAEQMIADQTTIDGGIITTGYISADRIAASSITADKIATDAIKSRNYISSGGMQGSFLNLSDGSFTSPNLSWDSNGNLIAKNVNLSGEIAATKGTIGGWSIISNSFFTKYNSSIDSYGTGISGDSNRYVLWAGEKNNAYGANRNSDTPTDATLRIWRNGAIEVQGNDSTTSGISHLYKILIQAGRINVGIDDHYIGSIAGSDTTLDNQVINQHVSLTAHKGYGWSILHTNDSGNLICDIKRDPNTNGIKFFDDLLISSGGNQIQLNANNQGSIELYGGTPFIDFHYENSSDDYTSRIIANGSNSLNITGNLWVDTDIHAGSWLYASEVRSSGAVVIASNSESYYWAHGYQMARGTSWGGVCIGDDSQGLRLYGTSIWASHSISTSDENLKENFTTLDQYEDFYMNLNPIGFNYIGDYDGKKTHFGFGAHKTEDILESEGYDSDKFAVVTHRPLVQEDIEKRFGKDVEVDIETEYGVSYTEFIALNTHMIQKTRKELEQVKQEKTDLEARLQAIEAKLGL